MNDAETKRTCPVCDATLRQEGQTWCNECRIIYPWPLLKATMNNWTFYAKLVTGEVVSFAEARIKGDWVTLMDVTMVHHDSPVRLDAIILGRGMVVQLNHIVWCSDEDS